MIRASLSNGDFLLGLDAENVRRLKAGNPIRVDLFPLGGQGRVLIMYGETLGDIQRELEQAWGQPLPLPQAAPDGPEGVQ